MYFLWLRVGYVRVQKRKLFIEREDQKRGKPSSKSVALLLILLVFEEEEEESSFDSLKAWIDFSKAIRVPTEEMFKFLSIAWSASDRTSPVMSCSVLCYSLLMVINSVNCEVEEREKIEVQDRRE
jgi:hypothetical protein